MRAKHHSRILIGIVFACLALLAGALAVFSQGRQDPAIWKGHDSGISGLSISPDGGRLATCGLDGTVILWDAASGAVLRILKSRDAELYAASFSRDGKRVVTTGNRGILTVFDAGSGKMVREIRGLEGWSADVAVSPDGGHVAAWGMDGRILLWDFAAQSEPRALVGDPKKWGMALAWSPDGRLLAAGRAIIVLWDVGKGTRAASLSGHKDFVRDLAFSPDGRLLASAGLDKMVKVWDVQAGRELYTITPEGFVHESAAGPATEPIRVPLLAVCFSPDGKMLATAGADRLVRLWEAETGQFIRTLFGHAMSVTGLCFSRDGKTLYSAGLDKTVRAWRLAN